MTPDGGPFSHPHRVELIDSYFDDRTVDPKTAWMDVYRLLLWADSTTGLAHCYESDKSQPGRPWYARSLEFHAWLSEAFGVEPDALADELDWMFRQVIKRVADEEAARRKLLSARAIEQRAEFAKGMPMPDDDPELRQIVEALLPSDPTLRPDDQLVRDVLRQVRAYIASENKRKNLLGRGFEDVLLGVIRRVENPPDAVGTQVPLEQVPGFRGPRAGDKVEKVDLWVGDGDTRRVLVSAKWSVRADREKQMRGDFHTYVTANEWREPFEYVWITNEFDPARLVANATYTESNQLMFTSVVHVCPRALEIALGLDSPKLTKTLGSLQELLGSGRIVGLSDWLQNVCV